MSLGSKQTVDLTATNAAIATIDTDTSKLDDVSADGLSGASNSIAYRIEEIEKHFHNREKWFGVAASPSGETHVADRVGGATSAFTLTAGNNDFGSWVQILGSSDTPVQTDYAYFDAHRYIVTTTNSTNAYIIQIVAGESADIATNLANEAFSETMYISASNNNDSGIETIKTSRIPTGTKVWVRTACIGGNGTTISLYFGLHEYSG